jgi:hypothetical protein
MKDNVESSRKIRTETRKSYLSSSVVFLHMENEPTAPIECSCTSYPTNTPRALVNRDPCSIHTFVSLPRSKCLPHLASPCLECLGVHSSDAQPLLLPSSGGPLDRIGVLMAAHLAPSHPHPHTRLLRRVLVLVLILAGFFIFHFFNLAIGSLHCL